MPIRNEAPHLDTALASVRAQVYPGSVRIFLGVGPSHDGTESLAGSLADTSTDLTVISNPTGKTPNALNLAIQAGTAPVVVRVDGHSQLSAGYIRRAVEILRSTGAVNVGGFQRPEPTTSFEEAVADATTSLLGTGGASYRVGDEAASVDTVYLGVFDRAAIVSAGLFDETLIRNQDYELNIRLRAAGGVVWFDPTLSVGYTPRSTWSALARQYFEYGWWKSVVLRKHPDSLRLRQAIPPVGIVGVILGLIVGTRWRPALLVPASYVAALVVASRSARHPLQTAAALTTTHVSWAAGLFAGFVKHDT
jgi:succinoglycan biosynthesis protein ExoA